MSVTVKRDMVDGKVVTTTTTVREAEQVVDYDDILDSITVEYDDWHCEAPWESCDGWEHDYHRASSLDHPGAEDGRGYGWSDANRESFVITISDEQMAEWGNYDYYRANGCSKQVARELTAQVKRDALDQLVKWYSDGWYWYQVGGEYEGYAAGCGGIDCYDYAHDEMRYEIADEIAAEMEQDGFIVTNRPDRPTWDKRAHFIDRLNRNKTAFVVRARN